MMRDIIKGFHMFEFIFLTLGLTVGFGLIVTGLLALGADIDREFL